MLYRRALYAFHCWVISAIWFRVLETCNYPPLHWTLMNFFLFLKLLWNYSSINEFTNRNFYEFCTISWRDFLWDLMTSFPFPKINILKRLFIVHVMRFLLCLFTRYFGQTLRASTCISWKLFKSGVKIYCMEKLGIRN